MLLLLVSVTVWAQTKDRKVVKPAVKRIPVYLGRSAITDGSKVSKKTFDSLLKQGLTSRDSLGSPYSVDGFALTYGERNLYEDSIGNLMWITDHLVEYCMGDSLTTFLLNNITERSKPGDTVYFDQITVRSAQGKAEPGKGIRLVLTK
ncbi:MAG: hypothetical protein K0R82_3 [Flavipsychrobacter sp.]|nr:hypothetical protein [Flavipsychrobacter sp.]